MRLRHTESPGWWVENPRYGEGSPVERDTTLGRAVGIAKGIFGKMKQWHAIVPLIRFAEDRTWRLQRYEAMRSSG